MPPSLPLCSFLKEFSSEISQTDNGKSHDPFQQLWREFVTKSAMNSKVSNNIINWQMEERLL